MESEEPKPRCAFFLVRGGAPPGHPVELREGDRVLVAELKKVLHASCVKRVRGALATAIAPGLDGCLSQDSFEHNRTYVVEVDPAGEVSPPPTTCHLRPSTAVRVLGRLLATSSYWGRQHVPPDPAVVQAQQRSRLGPFYKSPLPRYGAGDNLFLLGRFGASREPCTSAASGSVPLSSLVGTALGLMPSCKNVVSLVGKSEGLEGTGVGKSTAIFELSKMYYVVFTDCSTAELLADYGAARKAMAQVCAQQASAVDSVTGRPLENWAKVRSAQLQFQDAVNIIVAKRVLAKLLHLLLMLEDVAEGRLDPLAFFVDQLNGGRRVVEDFLDTINSDASACRMAPDLVRAAVARISVLTGNAGPVLAWDEIPSSNAVLNGEVVSPKISSLRLVDWWDSAKQCPREVYQRSFATSLLNALLHFGAPIVTAGTIITMPLQDLIESGVGNLECAVHMVVDFPSNEDPVGVLGQVFNLDGCVVSPERESLLRGRFTALVIGMLRWCPEATTSKQGMLNSAIDAAIAECRGRIASDVGLLLRGPQRTLWTAKLSKMVAAWHVNGGVLEWAQPRGDIDVFTKSLCSIVDDDKASGLCRLRLSEPLAVDVVSDVLRGVGVEAATLLGQFHLLCDVLETLSPGCSCKGCVLDCIVREVIKGVDLPAWCTAAKVVATAAMSAKDLGLGEGCRGDIDFLRNPPVGIVLVPQSQTSPGGVVALQNPQGRMHFLTVANKLSCELIAPMPFKVNTASSDVRLSFTQKYVEPCRNLEDSRRLFEATNVPVRIAGQLRIHVVIPGTSDGSLLRARVEGDEVLVFVHQGNLDDFFWEGVAGGKHAELMRSIKGAIRSMLP
eukprot:m51a1_g9735 hypothetical protein (841) ;mRNA; f:1530994-1533859